MFPVLCWSILILVLCILFMLFSLFFLEKKQAKDSDFPFECGMECSLEPPRVPFCIHFFLVVIVFLIFDIEFIVTLPLLFLKESFFFSQTIWSVVVFILFSGLGVEIMMGSIDWKKK